MSEPRVVSLAPSATATLAAMGAADSLVGVTAHCEVDRPVVGGWLNPDLDRVVELDPDLVLTSDALQDEVRERLRERAVDVHHTGATTLSETFDSFEALGVAVGRPEAGRELADRSRERVDRVRERVDREVGGPAERPVVYPEEWSNPPMAAGNWVPEAVEAAGGVHPFVDPGERSTEVDRETVEAADPDHVVLHICGHGERVDPARVRDRGWDIDAAVHVLPDSLLNQPSPRLVDGIERLAELLHGVETPAPAPGESPVTGTGSS